MTGIELLAMRKAMGVTRREMAALAATSIDVVKYCECLGRRSMRADRAHMFMEARRASRDVPKMMAEIRHLSAQLARLEARMLRLDGVREASRYDQILFDEGETDAT